MVSHAYARMDANGEVVRTFDFPEVGEYEPPTLDDVQRLAVEQALYKVLVEDVGTNRPGNLRDRVNDHYLDLYEQTGATGFEVRLNGRKVGTYGFPKTRAQPARQTSTVDVVDMAALLAYEDEDFNQFCEQWVIDHIDVLALAYFEDTGTLCDGMALVQHETPAQPAGIRRSGSLRIDPAKVADAMGPMLGEAVHGLLEGGE